MPGHSRMRGKKAVGMLAGPLDAHLVRDADDERDADDARQHQVGQAGFADDGEEQHRDHHDEQQKAGAAPRVQRLVPARLDGVGPSAMLVGVDHLVLGAVVHEDPPQVGQQRNDEDVDQEHEDTDEALDQVEQEGVGERVFEVLDDREGQHHEQAGREGDGDDDRDRHLLPPEMRKLVVVLGLVVGGLRRGGRSPRAVAASAATATVASGPACFCGPRVRRLRLSTGFGGFKPDVGRVAQGP